MDVTLGWSIGVRYIYLISVILNVYGGYTYIRRFSAAVSSFALDIYRYYNFAHILYLFHILIGFERQYV